MSQIALEKRLNEIRRLEGVKNNLIEALERIANTNSTNDSQLKGWARAAIAAANASHPAS